MHRTFLLAVLLSGAVGQAQSAVLQHSDVVFMYQAERSIYETYGATVVAWGGKPTAAVLQESRGLKFFGSVGMVTEFSRYYERFPSSYEEGLCRDIHGQPVKVPWLTDHQHKGIPFWWCCTQQPRFRQYLEERVVETVKAGADGVHIDDHLGTAGGLWLGLCFCDRCLAGFQEYLRALPPAELQTRGISAPVGFDYAQVMRTWLAEKPNRKVTEHPLWPLWEAYQCRAAAAFMAHLREVGAKAAGRPVPFGANAGLLWPRHLADYRSLDLFSAETDHQAHAQRFSDLPLFAYRLAEAVGRPYTATASGQDWAFIKERNLPGLVRGWIALGYAAGQSLMVPNHQWCYTPEKGTHWYEGPADQFAPLFQFVRKEATLLDGFETYADVAVVLPHRAFLLEPTRWFKVCQTLSSNNVAYRLLLGGDDIVDHSLAKAELDAAPALLVPDRDRLQAADRLLLEESSKGKPVFVTTDALLKALPPAVQVPGDSHVRVLPRIKPGAVVVHLLNFNYAPGQDAVTPLDGLKLKLNLQKLGIADGAACRLIDLSGRVQSLAIRDGTVEIPSLGLWAVLCLGTPE